MSEHFLPVAHIQTFDFTASLHARLEKFNDITLRQDTPGSAHKDTRTIYIRGPENPTVQNWFEDVPHIDYGDFKDWPEIFDIFRSLSAAVRPLKFPQRNSPYGVNAPVNTLGRLGKAMIVELKPGGAVSWHADTGPYAEAHHRFHLPLVTSPSCWLYSGGEQAQLPVGLLTWFDNHVMHSAVNFGISPRIHLIADYLVSCYKPSDATS